MGEIKGFIKTQRSLPNSQEVDQRIRHFKEFTEALPETHQRDQASRCMDCGIPFCHNACPLGNVIPDFNDAVYRGDWKEAYELLVATNNFPEFTGRICPAPCEASCVLSINSDAVSIEYIEKSIIEKAFEEGWVSPQNYKSNGKSVAIVGSGPAGLACADQLNKMGYAVTVFEKNKKLGGLLRYGIPDFKLEKRIVQRRIDLMKQEDIKFYTSVNVGTDIKVSQLVNQFHAVVLCGGSEKARDLPIKGRELNGIHLAMNFLKQCNQIVSNEEIIDLEQIEVQGKNVVVIGGGDTGSDCIGNSNRLGAASITQIELLGKPGLERSEDNPWPQWPMVYKTSSSQEEGCDRAWSICTKEFLSNDGKNISGILTVRVDWQKDENGKFSMVEIPGTEKVISCDVVFLALGFVSPIKEGMLEQLKLELDSRGNVHTQDYKTSEEKIFSAGDMRRGQSLVVWAIAEGRECANAVDSFIQKS